MTLYIYPAGCDAEQRPTISYLLSEVNGKTRVVTAESFNRACEFYVYLMKTEKELRENYPVEVCTGFII